MRAAVTAVFIFFMRNKAIKDINACLHEQHYSPQKPKVLGGGLGETLLQKGPPSGNAA